MYIYIYIHIYIYIYIFADVISNTEAGGAGANAKARFAWGACFVLYSYRTPNLPAKIIPTKIAWLKVSRKCPMDMSIPPRKNKILLETNPPESII